MESVEAWEPNASLNDFEDLRKQAAFQDIVAEAEDRMEDTVAQLTETTDHDEMLRLQGALKELRWITGIVDIIQDHIKLNEHIKAQEEGNARD